jgi:hypothetical protein
MLKSQTPEKPPELPPIERMIIRGVQDTLGAVFGLPPERIVFFASTNRIQIAQKVAELHEGLEGRVKWPVLMMHMNSMRLGFVDQMHGYNAKSLARHGQYLKAAESQDRLLKSSIVPIVMELEVIYMTDSFDQAFAYASAWLTNAVHNRANFTVTYMNLGIDVRCEMSPELSTPDREESVDMPNVFEYMSTIRVAGYASDQHPDGTSYIQLLHKPVINVSIGDRPEDDPKVWSGRHQMPIVKEPNK